MSGSWGVSLNGVYISGGKTTDENLTSDCPEQTVVGCLTSPPTGLGLPARRTEDVTFVQRDGVRHYSDWYEPRIITLERVVVCDDGCGGFSSDCSARQKVRDLLEAWSRKCCDAEMVVYTPCNSVIYDGVPTASLQTLRTNYFSYNSLGQAYTGNCGVFEFTDLQAFAGGTGSYSNYLEGDDLPAGLAAPRTIARKTWATSSVFYCRNYDKCFSGTRTNLITNPSFETNTTGWTNVLSTISQYASGSYDRAQSCQVSMNAASAAGASGISYTVAGLAATTDYTFSAWIKVPAGTSDIRPTASGAGVASTVTGTVVTVKDEWVRISVTFTTDADAGNVTLSLLNDTLTGGSSEIFYVDAAMLEEGTEVLEYFDGAKTDDAIHTYAWSGSADASASTDDFTATCYDNEVAGTNDGGGFIMGCSGAQAPAVTPAETYTISGYIRSNLSGLNLLVRVFFYNAAGEAMSVEEGPVETSIADEWVRISHTVTVPDGAVTMQFALDTAEGGPLFGTGDTLDATAVMVEKSDALGAYFDGNFTDSDNKVLGGEKVEYDWIGGEYASYSTESFYIYVAGRDHALNGPFGIIGRPRVAEVTWIGQGSSCATVLLRFDAVDQHMYILDQCGTPGYSHCVTIDPGTNILSRCYTGGGRCYGDDTGTWCYDAEVVGSLSVEPEKIENIGTETSYPTITLNGPLSNPRIQNLTTGSDVAYQANILAGQPPVVIYTEDMIAYQGDTPVSHLLSGSLDFSLDPGEHEIRVTVQSLDDDGDVDLCWRPSVVSA